MKKHIIDFVKRGALFSVGGPIVYAIVTLILCRCGVIESLSGESVVAGIFSSAVLAFIAAGISVVYDIEKLNLFFATLIHAVTIYCDYLIIYLLNGWSVSVENIYSILIFSAIFVLVYIITWMSVYFYIRRSVNHMNQKIQH